jgi:hypothetical protein
MRYERQLAVLGQYHLRFLALDPTNQVPVCPTIMSNP